MKICLVTAPTATDFEAPRDAQSAAVLRETASPHLGVLTLAAIVQERGCVTPTVVSLNRSYYNYLRAGLCGVDEFARFACDEILRHDVPVFGFSSICSSYPLTLRIAKLVKEGRPDCTVVLGGPQASVVDLQTLAAFPFIDFVLRGEADLSLLELLDELAGQRRFERVNGLTYRSPFGPTRNGSPPVIKDLDALPLPAFHLTDELLNATCAPLEIGRGCPYACTFCSTNDFFRRKFRLKSPQRVLEQMRMIAASYGITSFELTHDMFTVDRKRVVGFCEHMIHSGERFWWSVSARTDSVDEELLEMMDRAGCTGIFFGVETGSQRLQRVIDKDLDVARAKEAVDIAERIGIPTVVSLITGFPEETWDDLRDTVRMYSFALRHARCDPQLNVLSPLAETPIHTKWRDQLTLDELCSDMGFQGRVQNSADRELIAKYPDIFPNFYLLPVPHLSRDFLLELREFLLASPKRLRWLFAAICCSGDLVDVFWSWREHRIKLHPELRGLGLREYYMLDSCRQEFVGFVRQHRPEAAEPAVDCLLSYYEAMEEAKREQPEQPDLPIAADFAQDDIPVCHPRVYVFDLAYDVEGIVDALKSGRTPSDIDRSLRHFRTHELNADEMQLIETRPMIAAALRACNGRNTVADFLTELEDFFEGPSEVRRLGAECVLETLQNEKLITIYRSDVRMNPGRAELSLAIAG